MSKNLSPMLGATSRTPIAKRSSARHAGSGMAVLLVAALLTAVACSGSSSQMGTPELPADCDSFVTKYETCLKAAVPTLPALAKERSEQTRTALQEEARRATTATTAAATVTNLTALATKCHDNLQRLTATCGSSRTN
jgi:hypothetical protein